MGVKIGQAAQDERGKLIGGKSGDQTKREVAISAWSYSKIKGKYNHWTHCIRANDKDIAKGLAESMMLACSNEHIGYDKSRPDRYSLFDEAKKVNWDLSKVTNDCETCCGQLVGVCLYSVGTPTPRYCSTATILSRLSKDKDFTVLTDTKYLSSSKYLQKGDILISKGQHTAMVLNDGDNVKEETIQMTTKKYTGDFPDFVALTGEIIAQNAKESAWAYGTPKSKRTYVKTDNVYGENPHRYGKYGKNLDKAFPKRYPGWGRQPAAGASCDVFASTMVVSTGYDTKVPRGLGGRGKGQYKHFAESKLWKDVKAYKAKDRKPGDYILYLNKDHGGHACIAGGNGYTYEAGYTSGRYGCTVKAANYNASSKAIIGIYRPTKALREYIQLGDEGTQAKRVQQFLNWGGFNCGKADGIVGSATVAAIKEFQKACGIEVDGKFGKDCVAKAKTYTIEVVVTSKGYTGDFPTLPQRGYFKKDDKSNEVKKVQKFLNWCGNKLTVDGEYGSKTVAAVKKFQKSVGLKQDGEFGKDTLAKAKTFTK